MTARWLDPKRPHVFEFSHREADVLLQVATGSRPWEIRGPDRAALNRAKEKLRSAIDDRKREK